MARGIGASLGLERGIDLPDAASQLFHQACQDVVGADAQSPVEYLHRHVPIAEMPSNPHQRHSGMRVDLEQWLRRGSHDHGSTSFQHESVAFAQVTDLRQIEQEFRARLSVQYDAPAVSVVMVKEHRVDGDRGVPTGSR
jgi:hypothetical protein